MKQHNKIMLVALIAGVVIFLYFFKNYKNRSDKVQTQLGGVLPLELITKDKDLLMQINNNRYFPKNAFSDYNEHHKFLSTWFGLHLNSMEEKSLWKVKQTENKHIFRLLHLPTHTNPYMIRIEVDKKNKKGWLFLKGTDGLGGFYEGNLQINEYYDLESKDFQGFLKETRALSLEEIGLRNETIKLAADGTRWIIEINKEGKYFVNMNKSFDEDKFYEFGCQMINLLKLKRKKLPDSFPECGKKNLEKNLENLGSDLET